MRDLKEKNNNNLFLISTEICRKTSGPLRMYFIHCQYIEPPLLPIGHLNSLAEAVINSCEYDYGAMKQGHYMKGCITFA